MALTNEAFGKKVGCHHSMASRLRSGKRLPGVALMGRISKAFSIPLEDLMKAHQKGGVAFAKLLAKRANA